MPSGVVGALAAIEQRDLAEDIAGIDNIEDNLLAVGVAGRDADAPVEDAVKGIALVAFEKQNLIAGQFNRRAQGGDALDDVRVQVSKQKITRQKVANFQNLIPQTPETEGYSTQTSDEYGYAGANFMQANYFQKCEPVNRTFAPRGVYLKP